MYLHNLEDWRLLERNFRFSQICYLLDLVSFFPVQIAVMFGARVLERPQSVPR